MLKDSWFCGIEKQSCFFPSPCTQEFNSVVERPIRTLCEMALARPKLLNRLHDVCLMETATQRFNQGQPVVSWGMTTMHCAYLPRYRSIFDDTVFPCWEGVSMRKAEVSFDADIPWAGKELNTLPGGLDSSTSRSVSIFWRSSFTCRHLQTGSSSESFVSSSATILERMAALS